MNTAAPSRLQNSIFSSEVREQPVRLIKAAQAAKFLQGNGSGLHEKGAHASVGKKAEIRLVRTGPDFCDLEVICGCGETTQVRCWNTPGAEEKSSR